MEFSITISTMSIIGDKAKSDNTSNNNWPAGSHPHSLPKSHCTYPTTWTHSHQHRHLSPEDSRRCSVHYGCDTLGKTGEGRPRYAWGQNPDCLIKSDWLEQWDAALGAEPTQWVWIGIRLLEWEDRWWSCWKCVFSAAAPFLLGPLLLLCKLNISRTVSLSET